MILPHWIYVPALIGLSLTCFYLAWCAWLARGRVDTPEARAQLARPDVWLAAFLALPALWCIGKAWDVSDRLASRLRSRSH